MGEDTSSAPVCALGHLPLQGKALRDVEDAVPYRVRRAAGVFPLSVNRQADTPVDSSPEGGVKWRALHFGKGAIAGTGDS